MYYVYMLRCEDNSIYTGIAADLDRRMREHFDKSPLSAKYVRSRGARKLEAWWSTGDKAAASRLEYHIKKRLTRAQKERLIDDSIAFEELAGDRLQTDEYERGNGEWKREQD